MDKKTAYFLKRYYTEIDDRISYLNDSISFIKLKLIEDQKKIKNIERDIKNDNSESKETQKSLENTYTFVLDCIDTNRTLLHQIQERMEYYQFEKRELIVYLKSIGIEI